MSRRVSGRQVANTTTASHFNCNDSEDKSLEYLFKAMEQIYEITNGIDNRCFGTISITLILGIIVMLVSDISDIIKNKDIFIFFTPLVLTISLSVYSYNFTFAAIARGHLEAIEETINNKIGKNIFVYNVGFKKLYHYPHFTTNSVMGYMLFSICFVLSIICFIYIFVNISVSFFGSCMNIIIKAIYVLFSLVFDFIYIKDLTGTDQIRKKAADEFKRLYTS